MSAVNTKPNEIVGPLGSADKNKQWQRELLMERLRSHSSQNKTFLELSKAMRMSMLEKRYALDPTEKANLQKCLDSMQHCIKVTTRQGLIERLESLSRQLGLKFMEDTSGLFISSDMFYLEIVLDAGGTLSDVKVHHECKIEQQSCSELVTCLLKGDFADFTTQLEGLSSIYQLNAEPKIKSKAFVALQAMETDLYNLYMAQNFHKDTQLILLESSVGVVQKRRGGHPMKLSYFVSPYDLLDVESKTLAPLSIDIVSTKNIGMSVTVNLEASSANKLQILPTVTLNKDAQGMNVPTFASMTATNSTLLPATFVLRLNKPIPICDSLIEAIIAATEQSFGDSRKTSSIMELVVQNATDGELKSSSKGLFITLPEQSHCYFFTDNKQLRGSIISSIPYTEPSHVSKILSLLRQQALFYTLLASCVRAQGRMGDLENTTMLEVSAVSIHQISVALEHPFEESMATIEFDLSDAANVNCRIYSLTTNYDTIAVKLTKIIQKSLSIPITIRSLLKFWEQEQMKCFHRGMENGNFNLPLGPNDPGGRANDFRDMKGKNERTSNGSFGSNNRQFFHTSGVIMGSADGFSDNNVNMFDSSNDNVMINQFTMKSNHDANFSDTKDSAGGEDFYKNPKSKTDMTTGQNFSETSDSSSLGTSTPTSDLGVASINFKKGFQLDSDNSSPFVDGESSRNSVSDNLMEIKTLVESPEKSKKLSDEWQVRNSSLDSNVSILPVPPTSLELNSVLSGMGLERRPGIEIIPITAATTQSLPTSITITPINSSKVERKSNSNRKSDEKTKSDKKRKRRKEESSSSMGPPEKILSKQDSLNRPVSVSIKSTDGSPVSPSGLLRKFSTTSPKLSPSLSSGRPSPKHSPAHNSPKQVMSGTNSPKSSHYGTASPKNTSSGSSGKPSMSALKSATNSSPKSEKTSSKSSSFRDRDKEKEKDRGNSSSKGLSSGGDGSSPKIKSTTIKLKQIDLSAVFLPQTDQFTFDETSGPGSSSSSSSNNPATFSDVNKSISPTNSSGSIQNKVRKGSLSAVIDKLKLAQNTGDEILSTGANQISVDGTNTQGVGIREKMVANSSVNKPIYNTSLNNSSAFKGSPGAIGTPSSSNQNSEYMIKHSLNGMKITINKTRTKDPSSGSSSGSSKTGQSTGSFSKIFSSNSGSGGGSPKRHTGLKPGVNSGPASKKSQITQPSSRSSNSLSQSYSNVQGRCNFHKSNSSGSLSSSKSSFSYSSSKSMSSSSLSSDLFKKDKSKQSKSNSASNDKPTNTRADPTDVMKILRFASPNNAMEGFMKSLNTKFQIPKLSARTNDETKKDATRANTAITTSATTVPASPASPPLTSNVPTSVAATSDLTKPFSDVLTKDISTKYQFNLGKIPIDSLSNSVAMNNSFSKLPSYYTTSPPKYQSDAQNLTKPPSIDTTINNLVPKDFPSKTLAPAKTPPITTPIHILSPPYTPTIGPLNLNSTTSAYRTSTSVPEVPTVLPSINQNGEITMRPPLAPCVAVDMSKTAEIDLSMKLESKISEQRSSIPITLTTTATMSTSSAVSVRKLASTSLPQHKMGFPASPSVSVHIVKSPVPSPLMVMPSPHSNSPCITDDELMDEALVGIGGK